MKLAEVIHEIKRLGIVRKQLSFQNLWTRTYTISESGRPDPLFLNPLTPDGDHYLVAEYQPPNYIAIYSLPVHVELPLARQSLLAALSAFSATKCKPRLSNKGGFVRDSFLVRFGTASGLQLTTFRIQQNRPPYGRTFIGYMKAKNAKVEEIGTESIRPFDQKSDEAGLYQPS